MDRGSEEDSVRMRALVRARVQGVFFRDFAYRRAAAIDLVGLVRNLSDGRTVEVISEGPEIALKDFLGHLRQGPPASYVDDIDVEWTPATGDFTSFRVE